MSKSRVKIAELLVSAGFSQQPVLKLVGWPACNSVRLLPVAGGDPPAGNLIVQNATTGNLTTHSAEALTQIYPAAIAVASHLKFAGQAKVTFLYVGHTPMQQIGSHAISIPSPPGWPVPNFLKLQYPPSA